MIRGRIHPGFTLDSHWSPSCLWTRLQALIGNIIHHWTPFRLPPCRLTNVSAVVPSGLYPPTWSGLLSESSFYSSRRQTGAVHGAYHGHPIASVLRCEQSSTQTFANLHGWFEQHPHAQIEVPSQATSSTLIGVLFITQMTEPTSKGCDPREADVRVFGGYGPNRHTSFEVAPATLV